MDCNFEASLEDLLRDQFMCGLRSEAMHKRLLTEESLTLKRAIEIAIGTEAAQKDAKTFQGSTDQQGIHQIRTRKPCKHCGRTNHDTGSCYHRLSHCHNCGKQGHIAPICRERIRRQARKIFISEEADCFEVEIEDVAMFTNQRLNIWSLCRRKLAMIALKKI